jgi:hypothetical protein
MRTDGCHYAHEQNDRWHSDCIEAEPVWADHNLYQKEQSDKLKQDRV